MSQLPQDLNFGVSLTTPTQDAERVRREQLSNTNPNPRQQSASTATTQPPSSSKYDLKLAAHPIACIFTFIFKVLAIIMYLVIGNFISQVLTFIFVIVLSALDFWVVKNITGRLLVGLRWWSQTDTKGEESWKFESYEDGRVSNVVDKAFFWSGQFGGTVVWGVLLVLKVLSLSVFWSLLLGVNTALCGINLYGYYQCRGEHHKKVSELKLRYGKEGLMHLAGRLM